MRSLERTLLANSPKNGHFYVIAIDGRGASGKTTFAKYIATLLPDFAFLNGDDYFEPAKDGVAWGKFNEERFSSDVIRPLQSANNTFTLHPYDWHTTPHITTKPVHITVGVCLERCFSFGFEIDWDYKIWVETPKVVCLERGLTRENMPKKQSLKAWRVWQASEDVYIQKENPQKEADIIIDGTMLFELQVK